MKNCRIEGRYNHSSKDKTPVALILHPHPWYGGTMNNKVTYNMYKSFVAKDFSVLRFNFRGVGRSQGKFDEGIGELSDAAAALDWLQTKNPNSTSYWIGGFSFGSWIGMQLLMRRPEIDGFVSVSPPVNKYDFSFLSPCSASGLIIQGDQDSIVDEAVVEKFAKRIGKSKAISVDYKLIQGADHFFRDNIEKFCNTIDEYIDRRLSDNQVTKKVSNDRRRRKLPTE
ncbi:MAG: alpha/beta hydrolase [Pseudomonadota bacterium]